MARCHLVRVGAMGHVGRFVSVDGARYPRGSRVVLRTDRGLEAGEVLAWGEEVHRRFTDGSLLRGMTVEDELLQARLLREKQTALAACAERIEAKGLAVTLMDVDHLLDGQSLYFYFLGDTTPALESLIDELAEVYDGKAQFRQFAETLTAGCGPDCGTEQGGGCSSCSTGCALADACPTRHD